MDKLPTQAVKLPDIAMHCIIAQQWSATEMAHCTWLICPFD
jgi:hypothetical protein